MGKWLCIIAALLLVTSGCGSDTPTRLNTFTPLTAIVIEADLNTLAQGTSTQLIARGNYSGLFTRDITSQVTWSSAQPTVADFLSSPGRIKAKDLVSGVATITASLSGITATTNLTVSNATLTTLTITPQSLSLPKGLTQSFTVEGTFSDNSTQDETYDAVWSSSLESVATISSEPADIRVASAVAVGQTTISAIYSGITASTTLTVTDAIPVSIAVKSAASTQLSLSTQAFSATGTYSDDTSRDISADVTWSSSNPAIASIAADGKVKTLTPGTTVISATRGAIVGTSNLKVTGGKLTKIDLSLDPTEQIKGTSSRLSAIGTFDNATARDITGAIETWEVDSTKASVIDDVGNLVWLQALDVTPGTKLSASYGSVPAGEISLVVIEPALTSLTILEQAFDLTSGTSARLSLTGVFSPASNQNLAPSATWSSLPVTTATVGDLGFDKGRVRALTEGSSVITAAFGEKTATTTVTVVARTLQSLTILPVTSPNPIIPGTAKQFRVEALYTDGVRQDVTADATLTIDNRNIAIFADDVSDPGLIVAVDVGTATLTAKIGEIVDTEAFIVSQ